MTPPEPPVKPRPPELVPRAFETDPQCPKCGWHDTRLRFWVDRYDGGRAEEYLICTCRTCGYAWRMQCRDVVVKKDAQVRLAPERTPKLFLKVEKDSWPDAVLYAVGSFSMEPMYRTVFDGSGLIAVDREVFARIMTVRVVEKLEPDSFPQPGEVVS